MANKKTTTVLCLIIFLSAGCTLFNKPVPAGIIKTVNGGADWQFSNAIKSDPKASLTSLDISKLAFDPQNREIVYAGSYNGGLYKSEDSAVSWQKILSKIFVYDFSISPQNSKIIYATGFFGNNGKVLKTIDGGASWQEMYNEATSQNVVRALAINPANTNQLVIGTALGTVIRSSDGGMSWQLVTDLKDQVNKIFWLNDSVYVLAKTKGLLKAPSGGSDFSDVTASLNKGIDVNNLNPSTSIGTFSQAYIDPLANSLIYLSTNRGLFKSVDGGQNWTHILLPVKSDGLSTRSVAVAKTSSNVVFTNVGGTVYKSVDGGQSWQTQNIATTGFVNYILIDPQLPQIVYGGVFVGQ